MKLCSKLLEVCVCVCVGGCVCACVLVLVSTQVLSSGKLYRKTRETRRTVLPWREIQQPRAITFVTAEFNQREGSGRYILKWEINVQCPEKTKIDSIQWAYVLTAMSDERLKPSLSFHPFSLKIFHNFFGVTWCANFYASVNNSMKSETHLWRIIADKTWKTWTSLQHRPNKIIIVIITSRSL